MGGAGPLAGNGAGQASKNAPSRASERAGVGNWAGSPSFSGPRRPCNKLSSSIFLLLILLDHQESANNHYAYLPSSPSQSWRMGHSRSYFCGGLLTGMDLLIRSNVECSEKKLQDTHIEVTLAKVDIKDIKSDLTVVKSDVSNIKADLISTRTDLTNQIQLNRRMAGCPPFLFLADPNRPGVARGEVGNFLIVLCWEKAVQCSWT
ncbi:hypothetical protein HOY80DRAFT_941997 [Tuber brumale]|nr:hypothetical protein HOY80DRAFT_941997 [Tuber brumale]